MTRQFITFTVALTLVALTALGAATPQMPVSEIRPGMVGIGRTVFDGTRVEEFKVHVLGVIENVLGPQRNLILARLEGGPLAHTGVIAGMSGSPVYIDGRLIGAVSYALGSFSKEPIAGITPIEEMTREAAPGTGARPAAARLRVELPLTPEKMLAAFRRALNWNRPFADRPQDAQLVGMSSVPGLGGREVGTMLRPIATPLVMSGFEPDLAEMFGAAFREQGFLPMGGGAPGTRPGEMPFEGDLKPGDAIGVTFVSGDLVMGGTGTVTHIDGDQVFAFGHPMYNLGPTEFPMTRAYVYTLLPSLFSSSKLSTTGEVIGTLLQDRATAIAGRLGPGPKLIPVTLNLESERGQKRTFHFGVVKDQLFTPLMTYSLLLNTLVSYERQFGTATYGVKGKALLKQYDAVTFDNLFSGDSPSLGAAQYIVAPLTALMGNDYADIEIEGLELTFNSTEQPRTATLQRVWIDDQRPRAGRTVPLKVLLRTYRGEDVLRTVPIDIPANARGNLSILVSDGSRLSQAELRETRPILPRTVPQLIRTLNKGRRNSTLYIKLLGADAGAVVNGELLSSLPPSVLAVLEADRSGGSFNPLHSATLGEWEIPTDHAVSGVRTLTVNVSPN
jgi:ABC-type proline/glycine betaine transport system permease subunit